ncbi:DUF1932 domain-containing protein [Streptomyces xiamenensis]|uniref:NAD(P)-dependent oxidoreductase n=1 Tax=Streptomyces xiamenensis TaxID=408015 RepID=UPI003D725725
MTVCAVIGLGEAGRLYAGGLRDAGFTVRGYDPFTRIDEPGITQYDVLAQALDRATMVLSLVGARAAAEVLEQAAPRLRPGTVYADLNTAAPGLKRSLEERVVAGGSLFADVAVLAPVPRAGLRTPLLVSGTGAPHVARALEPAGVPVETIDAPAGAAAARKLLRSVFMKGLAGVVLETLNAAETDGSTAWITAQMAAEFGDGGEALISRLAEGSRAHAGRRVHEMSDAIDHLDALGQPSWVAQASRQWLQRVADEPRTAS